MIYGESLPFLKWKAVRSIPQRLVTYVISLYDNRRISKYEFQNHRHRKDHSRTKNPYNSMNNYSPIRCRQIQNGNQENLPIICNRANTIKKEKGQKRIQTNSQPRYRTACPVEYNISVKRVYSQKKNRNDKHTHTYTNPTTNPIADTHEIPLLHTG